VNQENRESGVLYEAAVDVNLFSLRQPRSATELREERMEMEHSPGKERKEKKKSLPGTGARESNFSMIPYLVPSAPNSYAPQFTLVTRRLTGLGTQ